ncbi:MAG: tyrosine-type recombinase/integrase [Candidatus Acidiferrales bacterium]
MSVYKRGKVYWYRFQWGGKLIQESTHQSNYRAAVNFENDAKTKLAQGNAGIRIKKDAGTLAQYIKDHLLPWVEAQFQQRPKSLKWYRNECKVLSNYSPLASARLTEINDRLLADFKSYRLKQGRTVSTVNSTIRVLRSALKHAVNDGLLASKPELHILPGATVRDHVVWPEEEVKYLAAATEPLKSLATILVGTGLRPDEAFRMRWENVLWDVGQFGAIQVMKGKTKSAPRVVPMLPQVRDTLLARWNSAGQPREGWVWPAKRLNGPIVPNSIYSHHLKAVKDSGVRPFVLYSLRHTFLTRLGDSGVDAWTLMRIAGHSNIRQSTTYCHSSDKAVHAAIAGLATVYKTRYSEKEAEKQKLLTSTKS